MTDREYLELAARAAGIEYIISSNGTFLVAPYMNPLARVSWNPLYDDGDAFRLQVRLRLRFDVTCYSKVEVWQGDMCDPLHVEYFKLGDDPLAVIRLAIVKVAAEVGRSMK